MGGAAGGRPRGGGGAAGAARERARRAGGRVGRAGVRFSTRGPRDRRSCRSEPTESHRLIEHLMIARQRGGGDAARERARCRRSTACTSARSRARVERLVDAARVARRPDAAAARGASTPQQAADLVGEISRLRRRSTCGAPGAGRAALTSLVLRSLKQARYSPAQPRPPRACARRATATSRRRSAATRTSSATARCWRRSAAARRRRARRTCEAPATGARSASATR